MLSFMFIDFIVCYVCCRSLLPSSEHVTLTLSVSCVYVYVCVFCEWVSVSKQVFRVILSYLKVILCFLVLAP